MPSNVLTQKLIDRKNTPGDLRTRMRLLIWIEHRKRYILKDELKTEHPDLYGEQKQIFDRLFGKRFEELKLSSSQAKHRRINKDIDQWCTSGDAAAPSELPGRTSYAVAATPSDLTDDERLQLALQQSREEKDQRVQAAEDAAVEEYEERRDRKERNAERKKRGEAVPPDETEPWDMWSIKVRW